MFLLKNSLKSECKDIDTALNNVYSKQLTDVTPNAIFTDAGRTTIEANVLKIKRAAIVTIFSAPGQANQSTVPTIVNKLQLYTFCGKPPCLYPFQGSASITPAFKETVTAKNDYLLIFLATSALFIEVNNYNPYNFLGITTTKITTVLTGNTAAVAAAAAAATNITAAILLVFNSRNLPIDLYDCYDSFNNSTNIMTQKAIQFFILPVEVVVLYILTSIHQSVQVLNQLIHIKLLHRMDNIFLCWTKGMKA